MSEKKKHKGESIIGKIIYATLLFMPLMSIFVRSMYVVVNKNAYESYSNYTEINTNYVNDNELVESGTLITLTYNGNAITDTTRFYILEEKSNIKELFFPDATWQIRSFSLLVSAGRSRLHVWDTNNQTYDVFNWQNTSNNFYFVTSQNIQINNVSTYYYNLSYDTYVKGTLDNVFEYSIKQVEQNSMYNWTTSTGTYDIIHTTTTGLGIQNSFVDLLLTYWILLTIIYIIYDIGLCLVMMAHRKVHSLIDSVD